MSELLNLPDELLVIILNYCATLDLVKVSRVCRKFNDLICDRKVVRVLNFHYQTKLEQSLLKTFLAPRLRADNVTTIDLTSCYWLTSSFIRDMIRRLRHVENVLVADTALLPNHLKQLLQTLSRIKRLSWTWRKGMDAMGIEEALKRLEFLYLCISDSKNLTSIIKWVNQCYELRELWINNVDTHSYMKSEKSIELGHLGKIVLYPCPFWPIVNTRAEVKQNWRADPCILNLGDQQLLNMEALYARRWQEVTHIVQLGSHGIQRLYCRESLGPNIREIMTAFSKLTALHVVMPPNEQYQQFLLDSLAKQDFNMNELCLDVGNKNQECSPKFCEVASGLPKLKKLSLPLQALVFHGGLLDKDFPTTSSSRDLPCRSRMSRATEGSSENLETPFKRMVQSTPLVEVFEIGMSGENNFKPKMPLLLEWDLTGLTAISQWKQLTSLTLANLPIMKGSFLIQVLKDCTMLKSLKIVDLGHEAVCVYAQDLYLALRISKTLEDFHWTQNYVGNTNRLWLSFQKIPTLQRIALCLQGDSSLNEDDVYETMEKCPRLSFLHVATCSTKVTNKVIKQNLMMRYSGARPNLCAWFGTPGEFLDAAECCPAVHAGEMLQEFSRIKGFPVSGSHFLSFGSREWAPHI